MANRRNIPAFSPAALARLRIQAGLSTAELALRIGDGVDPSRVSQWEGGYRGITATNLRALATALDTTPAALQVPVTEPVLGDLRARAALTQRELADLLNVPLGIVNRLEAGDFAPSQRSHTTATLGLTPEILATTPPGQLPTPLVEQLSKIYGVTSGEVQQAFSRSAKS